jgi:chromate transporter
VAAVAVVAHALWGMATKLCPDARRAGIAILAANTLILFPAAGMQVAVIVAGALLGLALLRPESPPREATPGKPGRSWIWLAAFFGLLLGPPLVAEATGHPVARIVSDFYRAGSLVFGGGHVVLPLLEQSTVESGWLTRDAFLAGYGAAQAMPGPLFSFSAYLGAMLDVGPGGVAGGLLALGAIYLPSGLLVLGVLPYRDRIRSLPAAHRALLGTNAAVVGLLGASFHDPVLTTTIAGRAHVVIAISAFGLLQFARAPSWLIVLLCAGAGALV